MFVYPSDLLKLIIATEKWCHEEELPPILKIRSLPFRVHFIWSRKVLYHTNLSFYYLILCYSILVGVQLDKVKINYGWNRRILDRHCMRCMWSVRITNDVYYQNREDLRMNSGPNPNVFKTLQSHSPIMICELMFRWYDGYWKIF